MGQTSNEASGEPICRVTYGGGMLAYRSSENTYQLLWARSGSQYQWVAVDTIRERPLFRSLLWRESRLPGAYVKRETDGGDPVAYWIPCAGTTETGWHLGKLNLRDGVIAPCWLIAEQRAVGVQEGILALFAPVPEAPAP